MNQNNTILEIDQNSWVGRIHYAFDFGNWGMNEFLQHSLNICNWDQKLVEHKLSIFLTIDLIDHPMLIVI